MKKIFTQILFVLFVLVSFTANAGSNIFIRGGVTNWGALPEWEFVDQGDGVYTLENKVLMGEFKVADAAWGALNYGSNGALIKAGEAYELISGSNSNITVDGTIECDEIQLTITESGATLLLKGTAGGDEPIEQVYVIGDNNGWNFTDKSGVLLPVDEAKTQFEGVVTFPAGSELSYWRIFENVGQVGSWGFDVDSSVHTVAGTLTRGKEGCVTVLPNTYKVTFDLETGVFSAVVSSGVNDVDAETNSVTTANGVITVTGAPSSVNVYSISGALISANKTTIDVATGIYIVVVDGVATKIAVR